MTIVLFFVLRISGVIGDLTGSTAKKAIRKIREGNGKGTERVPSDHSRGAVTDRMTPSGRVVAATPPTIGALPPTEKIPTIPMPTGEATTVLYAPAEETTLLSQTPAAETTLLPQVQAAEMEMPAGETAVLPQPPVQELPQEQETVAPVAVSVPQEVQWESAEMPVPTQEDLGATTVLAEAPQPAFWIEYDITYIHTQEYITEG